MGAGVIAQQGTGAFEVGVATGVAVLALAVAAACFMVWLHVSTRPSRLRSVEPTMELRSETPAVVDLLTGGFEVEDDSMPATVIDLAARGWFSIDDIGGDRIVLRLREHHPSEPLTAYEERVMRHLRAHARDAIVPAPVLTLGPEGVSDRWFRGFRREVTAHARELGLCHRRYELRHVVMAWGAVALAAAPAGIVASTAPRTTDPTGWGTLGNLFLGLSFVIAFALAWAAQRLMRSDAQVDTPAGLEAARHWQGVRVFYRDNGRFEDKPAPSVILWERNLAYATALGLAPLVQRQIPFETEHDRNAWSLQTGHWRRVRVGYGARVPGWGEAPWMVAFSGLVRAVVTGALAYAGYYVASNEIDLDAVAFTDDQRRYIGLAGLVFAVAMAALFALAVGRLLLGLSDLFPRRTVEGELVRKRDLPTGHSLPRPLQWVMAYQSDRRYSQHRRRHGMDLRVDDRRRRRLYLAVDPGDRERIRAFRVRRSIFDQVQQTARVRATVSPRLGYVASIETTAPPRATAASEPGSVHPLAAEAAEKAIGAVLGRAGGLSATMAQLEQMVGPDGSPMLDQRDDDGVSLRERLAEGERELDRLREVPETSRTPLLGQILDTLGGDGRPDDHPGDRDRTDRDPEPGPRAGS